MISKKILKNSILMGCVAYPILVFLMSLIYLYDKRSFNFWGFHLDVTVNGKEVAARPWIDPSFVGALIVVTFISFLVLCIFTIIKEKAIN